MRRLAMKRRLRAPGPAFVVSLIALFVALGGTTYAATSLPAKSVGTAQLKNGAVTDKKAAKKLIVYGAKAALIAGVALNAQHASSSDTATSATTATNATHAANADHAATADSATNATNATTADSATNAKNATNATNATNAANATNATTVGGFAPNGLVRSAEGSGFIPMATGTAQDIASVLIDAPSAGFVIVNGSAMSDQHTGTGCPCVTTTFLNADGSDIDKNPYPEAVTVDGVNEPNTASLSWVFQVAAGAHTFALRGYEQFGTGPIDMSGQITASFVPFDWSGVNP